MGARGLRQRRCRGLIDVDLRVLVLVARLLDPRLWRRRLLQLGGLVGAVTWVWVRAVQRAPVDTVVRDTLRSRRRTRIRERNAALEQRRLGP